MVVDEEAKVFYDDLSEVQTNALVKTLITQGLPPLKVCCGRKEWFQEVYGLQLSRYTRKEPHDIR
jgi:hypothetical protein